MALPILIPLALKAAEAVPGLLRILKGDDKARAATVAEKVVGAAKAIAGIEDPEQAVDAVQADPELLKLWVVESHKVLLAELEAETEQLRVVNETMRAEVQSEDPWVRRWRPIYGYQVGLSWSAFMAALCVVLVRMADKVADPVLYLSAVTNVITASMPLWGFALTVLGLAVRARTRDKEIRAGALPPPGFAATIANAISKKGPHDA